MMYLRQLVGSLFLLIELCVALEFNTTNCVKTCLKEKEFSYDDSICTAKCLESFVENRVIKGYKRQLPKPTVPTVLENGWQMIRLSFNTSNLANFSGVDYILEVKPDWDHQQKNGVFTVFPYLPKYHNTTETSYSVEDLEPNTGYRFRVIAVRSNQSSDFSDWSDLTRTTKNCSTPACGINNVRLELTSKIPHKGKEMLKSVFYWEPTTLPSSYYARNGYVNQRKLSRLSTQPQSWCSTHFKSQPKLGIFNLHKKDIFTNKSLTTYTPEDEQIPAYLYYGCWYKFEMWVTRFIFQSKPKLAFRQWIFHIPNCITVKNDQVCGCPYVRGKEDKTHSVMNVTIIEMSNTSTAHLNWNDRLWHGDEYIKYYSILLRLTVAGISTDIQKYHDAQVNLHNYNTSFGGLEIGKKYRATLSAFHSDHCIHHVQEYVEFVAKPACDNVTCPANSTCYPVLFIGETECLCDNGFAWRNDQKRCIDARCENNPNLVECDREEGSRGNIEAIIAGVVPALVIIILIAAGIIIWLRYFHRKRMNFIQREFEDAVNVASANQGGTFRNAYDFQHPIDIVMLPQTSNKEINLLYVSQENLVIPDDLLESICLFELPGDRVRLRCVIGKGAFGEVHIGEAQGVNDNPEWTTVAIKTLVESVKEDEVYDFLREIELMKDLGKHENVIQMFGCCTRCRPICLVLEYASGGNLLNYLRSLKKKCKEIAAARAYAMINPEKEKFQKFFEADEMPDTSTSYSFPAVDDPYKRPATGNRVKQAEALNLDVALKIKEELRTAMDPKELESFARQIACGMEHVAGLGIVHRDLAARNILLDENKVLKISDFGLSREGTYIKQTRGKIPYRWLSIEAIIERFYSTASDVWAFGIVLWEICTLGDVPYSSVSDKDLEAFLLSGKRMEKVESCTDDIYEIMLKCWSHFPEDRPSFTELSKRLWDLEHNGNTYVNIESLMQRSFNNQAKENQEEGEQDNNNMDNKSDIEDDLDVASNKGFDNQGFSQSVEDLNDNDEEQIIPNEKKSLSETAPNKDKKISTDTVVNGVKNNIDSEK